MKSWRIVLYAAVGGALGALAGVIFVLGAKTPTDAALSIGRVGRLALVGAVLSLPGGIIEKSVRKSLISALAGGLGLIVIVVFLLRIMQMDLGIRTTTALVLLMFCAFGALLAVMHALLDEDYRGISYSVIMGANGGLAGIALAFLGAQLLGQGDGGTVILAMVYNATVWAAIAVARKLELLEREELPAEASASDSSQDNP